MGQVQILLQNLKVFWCFQGVQKEFIGNKCINRAISMVVQWQCSRIISLFFNLVTPTSWILTKILSFPKKQEHKERLSVPTSILFIKFFPQENIDNHGTKSTFSPIINFYVVLSLDRRVFSLFIWFS